MTMMIPLSTKEEISAKFGGVRKFIHDEYSRDDGTPWVIAYSGGKDSTLLLHLVWECVVAMPPADRVRPIYVINNDTLVESPMVQDHANDSMLVIAEAATIQEMPIKTHTSKPYADQTFWVNIIGRGYIPPTRNFRWCTDRMKIQPTDELIRGIVRQSGEAVLLIGTRMAESSNRRQGMMRVGAVSNATNPHNSIPNCRIMTPLAELEDNDVWMFLLICRPPWGGSHSRLVGMYKNAGGGECPLVLTKADAPSCGTTSPRFGCWTCTVVKKDRSLLGTIQAGDSEGENLLKMADFRDYLIELREDDSNRWPFRRNGITQLKGGKRTMGPFKIEVRQDILDRLHQLENETDKSLISAYEEDLIRDIWRTDRSSDDRASKISLVPVASQ